jgi:hypothetical protein
MLSVEKPGSPAELVHHGVKGQKWGVRRNRLATSGSGSSVQKKVTGSSAFKGASKASNKNVQRHYAGKSAKTNFRKRNPTSRDKADAIRLARATSRVKYEKATALANSPEQRRAAKLEYKKDPQRAAALRTTRGEKVVIGLLLASGIATVPIAAVVTGGYAYRRHVENKQARGGYK